MTPEGVERAIHLGEDLVEQGIIDAKSRVDLLHSPKARARGTLEFIVKGAGLPSDEYFEVQEIRSSDYADLQTFLTREKDLGLTLDDVAREHYENRELYHKSSHIVETHANRRLRFYKFISDLVLRRITAGESFRQVLAVSHFEIMMHIIDDIFGIKTFSSYMAPALGEYIILDFYLTDESGVINMDIYFRDRNKQIRYDFISRDF
ncbi:MAG: phosphoglycerate mutase family protein [Candidatus Moraniibacteriota bacterium]|nr:MAG: phosphoglycerate mutase family protein [Candidatus Moranbacteria bacterium]